MQQHGMKGHCSTILKKSNELTLFELLMLVAIIGLLSIYVGPLYLAQIGNSAVVATRVQIDTFSKALHAYRPNAGRYPIAEQCLNGLLSRLNHEPKCQRF